MENAHTFAVMLEAIFRRIDPNTRYNADDFDVSPKDTFDMLLQYFEAEGFIDNGDYCRFLEEYDFGEGSLSEYLVDDERVKKIEELIRQLNCIIDAREA